MQETHEASLLYVTPPSTCVDDDFQKPHGDADGDGENTPGLSMQLLSQ